MLPLNQENTFQDHKKAVLQVITLKNILNCNIEKKVLIITWLTTYT